MDVLVVVQNDRLQAVLPEGTPEELLTLASDDVLRQVRYLAPLYLPWLYLPWLYLPWPYSRAILTVAILTMAILTMAILPVAIL